MLKAGLFKKHGKCSAKCTLSSDVVYPRGGLNLHVTVDNTESKKPVEKYVYRLTRRVEFINLSKKKPTPIFMNDTVIHEEDRSAACEAGKAESFEMTYFVPDHFYGYLGEDQRKMMPKLEYADKHMQAGLSNSLSGQLFKVMYVLQFEVHHKGFTKPMVKVNMPVMIMSPESNVVRSEKKKINEHPSWKPYEYSDKALYLTPEEEEANNYLSYRRRLIDDEAKYIKTQAKRAESMYWDAQ